MEVSDAPAASLRPSPSGRSSSATKTERGASTKISKASALEGDVSILKVPGVGPKNAQLFFAKGLATIGQLLVVHKSAHGENIDKTKAYIQVGGRSGPSPMGDGKSWLDHHADLATQHAP